MEVLSQLVLLRPKLKASVQRLLPDTIAVVLGQSALFIPVAASALCTAVAQSVAERDLSHQNVGAFLDAMLRCDADAVSEALARCFLDAYFQSFADVPHFAKLFISRLLKGNATLKLQRFCHAILLEGATVAAGADSAFVWRYFSGLLDAVCLACLLLIPPESLELSIALQAAPENIKVSGTAVPQSFFQYKDDVAAVQAQAICLLTHESTQAVAPEARLQFLRRLLFLHSSDEYFLDDTVPEVARARLGCMAILSVAREATLQMIGQLGRSGLIKAPDALVLQLDLADRALPLHCRGFDALRVTDARLVADVLALSLYKHSVPLGQLQLKQPVLAVRQQYWMAWQILFRLTVANPSTVGEVVWAAYPTVRTFIVMAITSHFTQTLIDTSGSGTAFSISQAVEQQLIVGERDEIFEFECSLAEAAGEYPPLTHQQSVLLERVMRFEPAAPTRTIPASVLAELANVCLAVQAGLVLCRCRAPDYLLQVMNYIGPAKSADLLIPQIASSPTMLDTLPLAAIGEVYLRLLQHAGGAFEGIDLSKRSIAAQSAAVWRRLQSDMVASEAAAVEILMAFVNKLTAPALAVRNSALEAVRLMLRRDKSVTARTSEHVALLPPAHVEYHAALYGLAQIPGLPLAQVHAAWLKMLGVEINVSNALLVIISLLEQQKPQLLAPLCDVLVRRAVLLDAVLRHAAVQGLLITHLDAAVHAPSPVWPEQSAVLLALGSRHGTVHVPHAVAGTCLHIVAAVVTADLASTRLQAVLTHPKNEAALEQVVILVPSLRAVLLRSRNKSLQLIAARVWPLQGMLAALADSCLSPQLAEVLNSELNAKLALSASEVASGIEALLALPSGSLRLNSFVSKLPASQHGAFVRHCKKALQGSPLMPAPAAAVAPVQAAAPLEPAALASSDALLRALLGTDRAARLQAASGLRRLLTSSSCSAAVGLRCDCAASRTLLQPTCCPRCCASLMMVPYPLPSSNYPMWSLSSLPSSMPFARRPASFHAHVARSDWRQGTSICLRARCNVSSGSAIALRGCLSAFTQQSIRRIRPRSAAPCCPSFRFRVHRQPKPALKCCGTATRDRRLWVSLQMRWCRCSSLVRTRPHCSWQTPVPFDPVPLHNSCFRCF